MDKLSSPGTLRFYDLALLFVLLLGVMIIVNMDRTGFADLTGLGASAIAMGSFFSVPRLDPIHKRALLAQVLTAHLQSPSDAFALMNAIWQFYRETEPDTAFSFDAGWSQRRQANHCFRASIDCKQQKFVDFEVVSRSFGRQKKFICDFEGASKTMESRILRQLVDWWHGREEITAFMHDQDVTASAI